MLQEEAKVLWNQKVGPEYYRIGLTCGEEYSKARPGQFIMLRFPGRMTPFLRRPFSIHQRILADGRTTGIEILYKVVGEGTRILSKIRADDIIDILGPLGNGFFVSNTNKNIYIVAGGIGVAPMVFLASYLVEKGIDPSRSTVFLGGRSTDDLLCRDDFLRIGMKLHITTDDGSAGDQCFVTHPLETESEKRRPDIVYACGPMDMLKCVVGIAEKYGASCQISIETMMACGIGACLGCAVERKGASGNYLHACMDGPVIDADMIEI